MTTMTRLSHTPSLHSLLQSVSDSLVVHHSGCGAWPEGWSWTEGHMGPDTQDLLDELKHAGLITASLTGDCKGSITAHGADRLQEWTERYPKGGAE